MSLSQDVAKCVELALGIPAVLSFQPVAGAPRPAATYATVRIASSVSVGASPHKVAVKGAEAVTASELRVGTAQVDVWGPGAADIAETLALRIRRLAVSELAFSLGINLQQSGPVLEAPELRDTVHEEHAQAEIQVQRVFSDVEPRELIETIEANIELKDVDGTPVETVQVTVTIPP